MQALEGKQTRRVLKVQDEKGRHVELELMSRDVTTVQLETLLNGDGFSNAPVREMRKWAAGAPPNLATRLCRPPSGRWFPVVLGFMNPGQQPPLD